MNAALVNLLSNFSLIVNCYQISEHRLANKLRKLRKLKKKKKKHSSWRVVNKNWNQPPEALLYQKLPTEIHSFPFCHLEYLTCCCFIKLRVQRHWLSPCVEQLSHFLNPVAQLCVLDSFRSCRYRFHQSDCNDFISVQSRLQMFPPVLTALQLL